MADATVPVSGESDVCTLANPAFTHFEAVAFRRSPTDGVPVMAIRLGDREAVVPLDALQRELGIAEASPDGLMLDRVVRALDFVADLHPGDKFPAEVVDGGASWSPGPEHRLRARQTLQRALIKLLEDERGSPAPDAAAFSRLEDDAELRDRVTTALRRAAASLQLPSSADVVPLIAELAAELSYIEALRDRLLVSIQAGRAMLARYATGFTGNGDRVDALTRVRRLTAVAAGEIAGSFVAIDARTAEILPMLRDPEGQRAFLRAHRNDLYRTLRTWEPTLRLWAGLESLPAEEGWVSISRSYQFLAQRYMQSKTWTDGQKSRPARHANAPVVRMER